MPVPTLKETPSQTGGPYVHIGTMPAWAGLNLRTQEKPWVLTSAETAGERIRIEGIVYDGAGAPVRDALVEIWQADSHGRYNAPGFSGWGRAAANFETALWSFETIKPGSTPWRDGRAQAPHVSLLLFARGINIHLHTRMYFDDEAQANAVDPVLNAIEQRHLVETLVGKREARAGETVYRFEIHLQGDRETVFLDM